MHFQAKPTILNNGECLNFSLITCFLLLMRLIVLHRVADGFVARWMENYRNSFIRNNRVKKTPSEPDAVIKRVTFGSRAIGSRPMI